MLGLRDLHFPILAVDISHCLIVLDLRIPADNAVEVHERVVKVV
jgi:hypothetical protein